MSPFGAAKKTTTFQKAKERLDKMMADTGSQETVSSSGMGKFIEKASPDGTATTSEIANELTDLQKHDEEEEGQGPAMVLDRELYNQAARIHNREAREQRHPSQEVTTVHGGSSVDKGENLVYKQWRVYTIPSDTSSSLSPPPTTDYGGSEVSFPQQTQRQSTKYEGSILGFPPSAIPEDPF